MPLPDACPLCGNPIDPAVRVLQTSPEPLLRQVLERQNPGWQSEQGACPDCVFRASLEARKSFSPLAINAALDLPYPVYHTDSAWTAILPIPFRVPHNPRYTGQGVTIAFLDSGYFPHVDLVRPVDRIVAYADASGHEVTEPSSYGKIQATSWHGTMVAGVGIGSGFASDGRYRGLAPKARAVLVKTGNQRNRGISERDIGRALKWVIANRKRFDIRIVNVSVGGDHVSTGRMTELDERVEEATAAGLLVVCAAGNSRDRGVMPPASAPSALTVGGLDDQNSLESHHWRMYWSSYGCGARGVAKPDLIAPALWLAAPMLPKTATHNEAQYLFKLYGADDKTLAAQLDTSYAHKRLGKRIAELSPDDARRAIRVRMSEGKFIHPNYQHVDGTSMAAPIVSAIAAQMLEANPALSPEQLKALLTLTAERLPNVRAEQQGAGRVNGARAVAAALRLGALHEPTPVSPQRTITFHYYDTEARQVAVVGDFNRWLPYGFELEGYAPGAWRLTVPEVGPGLHAYKFLIDRVRWSADPENPHRLPDGSGGFFSLLDTTL
jgi:serine protease AprX